VPSTRHLAAGLLTAALLAACSSPAPTGPEPVEHGDTAAQLPSAASSPTWNDTDAAAAATVAARAMTAFVRSDLDPDTWRAQLQPFFTPGGWDSYSYVDPDTVPAAKVTGSPAGYEVREQGSPFLAEVAVPTDIGAYRVLLSREAAGTPWLVEQLTPPEDAG
jgi:hypothetical protein